MISYTDDHLPLHISVTARRPVDDATFGIKTSQANTTYDQVLAVWRDADQIPVISHAWLWDHMVPLRGAVSGPALEGWTLLGALAGQTKRLELGIVVTNNRMRPPAVLAKMAATVDHVAAGRLVFGIGAGGSRVGDPAGFELVRREFEAFGIEIVATRDAIGALEETVVIAKRLWTEETPFDFDGRYYKLRGAICEPKPVRRPRPPILIGAGGDRSLRIVAAHADIWNMPSRGEVGEFEEKGRILDDHCVAIGRDPAEITRSVQLLVTTAAEAKARADQPGLPSFLGPEAGREAIRSFYDVGARHFVLAPVVAGVDRPARWLADEVIEPLLTAA
jgi:alkanesulfonate monooxygenase SsuD/methylene tetrahydromethanopterin reductase-like flavin-dependent oxidoreductase (luciferase family)